MKLREVFRFEIGYQLRRRSIWIYAAAVPLLSFHMMKQFMRGAMEEGTFLNAPIDLMSVTMLVSLFGLLITAALASDAATRDVQLHVAPLLYTAPLRRRTYVAGRFLGVFAVNAALLAAVPLGLLFAVLTAGGPPELVGPFRLGAFVRPYLIFALPNAFTACALLFTAALLSRRVLASYGVGAFLFAATMFSVEFGRRLLDWWGGTALLDPFGAAAISTLVQSWTPFERNTLLVPLEDWLLWNRILWLGLAVGVLAYAHARLRFAHHAPRRRAFGRRVRVVPEAAAAPVAVAAPHVERAFGPATHLRQALAVAQDSFREIVASRGWLLPVGGAALMVLVGPELLEHIGVPILPTTNRVLGVFDQGDVPLMVVAFVVFCAGELAWQERDARLHALSDAAPVPDAVFFGGKLLGLGLSIVAIQAVVMAAGVVLQLGLGGADVEPGLYARVLFGFQLADYLLVAALAFGVHVLVNQKYVGHLVVLLAYAFTLFAGALGIEHKLLVYGSDVGWAYSDLSGFGASVVPFFLFKLYWTGWALLLALAARLFWVRGAEDGLRKRLRSARRRLTRPALGAAVPGAVLVLGTGGFIFYNTNVLNDYHTAAERAERRAEYERRYGRYEHAAQPHLVGTKLHVEIYPGERAVTVRGTYRLVNRSGVAIDTLHVATASDAETGVVDFGRPAETVLLDDDLGHRIYALNEPLRPGEAMPMRFDVRFAPRGFTNGGVRTSVAGNGTYFEHTDWLPAIGYQPDRELAGVGPRRAHGLAPRPAARSLHDAGVRHDVAGREMIDFEATVGTDSDQVALAPGTLRRTWTEGGRRYFHYATDAPIRNGYAFFSAAYGVHASRWKDPDAAAGQAVEIQIFHHPDHTLNLDRMVHSIRASLDYFTEHFGPYLHRQIRLAEVPGAGIGLRAYPINMRYTEGFSFMNPEEDHRDLDFLFAVVAHEVAHQWWGNQLVPAEVEGAPLLSESLAWYSTFGVVEQAYGEAHLRRLLALLREAYQAPRPQADLPLLRAADWFAAYRKGPFAMYTLRAYAGEERVNAALRRLLERHGAGRPPLPTSLDLYAELQAVTPDSLRYLLADLFERNTFWELKAKQATAEPAGTGLWRVTLDVSAQKVEVDSAGVTTEHPMDDLVEVGVFAAAEDGGPGEPLYLQKHRIRSGEQRITVTVPGEPARAGVDPRHLLIDTATRDNVADVERIPESETSARRAEPEVAP